VRGSVARKQGQSLGPFGRLHYDISARVERRSKRDGGEVLDSSDVELLQSSWDVEEYLSHLLVEVAKSASFSLVCLPVPLPLPLAHLPLPLPLLLPQCAL